MLDMCRNNNLYIANGRFGEKSAKLTCRDASTVDYVICNSPMFKFIDDLEIHNFCSLYSDVHCPISLHLQFRYPQLDNQSPQHEYEFVEKFRWDPTQSEEYKRNIDLDKQKEISNDIKKLRECSANVLQTDIDRITKQLCDILIDSASKTFKIIRTPKDTHRPKLSKKKSKPWFNNTCKTARKQFHLAKRLHNRNKTPNNLSNLKQCSKNYKKAVNDSIKEFNHRIGNELNALRKSKPKDYWKVLNSINSKNVTKVDIDLMFEFLKQTNDVDEGAQEELDIDLTNDSILNCPITPEEIEQAVHRLKSNKSPGNDQVVNEYICSTLSIFLTFYVDFFNLIFDAGVVPEEWLTGIVKPIYKNKGDPHLPDNYRPITLLSCMGKLFTSILCERLNNFADEIELISKSQTGFRKRERV